jgi:hypothetical protein
MLKKKKGKQTSTSGLKLDLDEKRICGKERLYVE